MKRYFTLLLILSGTLWFSGCSKDRPAPEYIPVDEHPKTLIFYGNIGEPWYSNNVEAAGRAVAAGALSEGHRIIVYHEKSAGNLIYELVRDRREAKGYRADTLKKYAVGEVSTLNPADMKKIIGEIRDFTPGTEHYGLAFGSHARGWVSKDYVSSPGSIMSAGVQQGGAAEEPDMWQPRENPLTRYLGSPGNYARMDISELAGAVDELNLDFVLFDACFMGSVEAAYDMRNAADYLIVSPAEVLIAGFPYERIVKSLFTDWTDMAAVAHAYVNSYVTGSDPYATVSVVKTSELERLADAVHKIYDFGYNEVDAVAASKIQAYDAAAVHVFYDLDHYIGIWATDAGLYGDFLKQLRKTVVYKEHTDCFFSDFGNGASRPKVVPIMHYSGLSAFIPTAATAKMTPFYEQTEWYKAVRGEN